MEETKRETTESCGETPGKRNESTAECEKNAAEKPEKTAADKEPKETKEDDVARLSRELGEQNDKYLRMLAEYDNYRRRTQKERESTYRDAVVDTLKGFLPIADNLERASAAEGEPEAIRRGLAMTLTALADLLKKCGVEAFGEVGEVFDPNLHNAVMHASDPDAKENTVVEVFQRGYRLGDKIIRFAMVKVAN